MIIQKDVWHISYFRYILPVVVGGAIVVLTGFIDDIFELKPLPKMLGIVIGAVIVWAFTDFRFDSFKIPFWRSRDSIWSSLDLDSNSVMDCCYHQCH